MIGPHLSEARLNAYVEGGLARAELARAERHLAECVRCREAANRLGGLLEQLRAMPRELDPGADLMPAIRAETRQRRAVPSRRASSPQRRRAVLAGPTSSPQRGEVGRGAVAMPLGLWWPRAVAAAALILAAAVITVFAVRSSREAGAPGRAPAPVTADARGARPEDRADRRSSAGASLDELRRLEAEYARAADQLLATFQEDRDRLGTGTVRVIDDNIRTVERALRQSQQALSTDPDSPVLRELVLAAHRQRLDMVRRAAVVAAGS